MRLSLKKAAHAALVGASSRKSGISLVFREMWDSTAVICDDLVVKQKLEGEVRGIPRFLGRKGSR
jgi:hypothetical protein